MIQLWIYNIKTRIKLTNKRKDKIIFNEQWTSPLTYVGHSKKVLIYEYEGIQEFEYQNYHNNLKLKKGDQN